MKFEGLRELPDAGEINASIVEIGGEIHEVTDLTGFLNKSMNKYIV